MSLQELNPPLETALLETFLKLDQAALDALPIGLYACDSDGHIIRVNRRASELWGRTPRLMDAAQRFCGCFRVETLDGQFFPPDQTPMACAVRRGESFEGAEAVVHNPDGKRWAARVTVAPLIDAGGDVIGAINCFQDVTREHEMRRALERQQRTFDLAMLASQMGTWRYTIADNICIYDENAQDLYGLTKARFLHDEEGVKAKFHPDDMDHMWARVAKALDPEGDGRYEVEYRVKQRDGSWRWLSAWGLVEFEGEGADRKPVAIAGASRDLTDRKVAEQTHLRNEAWAAGQKGAFQAAMNGAPLKTCLGMLLRTAIEQAEDDRRCAFYIANADSTELSHVVGMPESYARQVEGFRIAPDSFACGLAASIGQPVVTRDVNKEPLWQPWLPVARDHDFRGCWSFPIETASGKVVGTFAMYFRDPREPTARDRELIASLTDAAAILISRHQEAEERSHAEAALRAHEEQLRRLNETLEARVQDEIAERERIQKDLFQSQKLEAIGQLTGGVAHDFNNLLTAIIGNLDALLRTRASDHKRRHHIEAAIHAAERGAELTQQLLAYARKQHLAPRTVQLNALLQNMEDLLRRSLGGLVAIETRLADDVWAVASDPTQIELAILNLAINARDAMPLGGSLLIETRNVADGDAALPGDLKPGDYVRLSISDTGEGMPADVLARATDPFFTTKVVGKGSGLGLSQVYGIVQQSGGTLKLESELGRGTTVLIWLPRTADDETAVGAQDQTARPSSREGSASVLVVDDNADVREIAAEMLREVGYRVQEAASGAAALKLLDSGQAIDIALVDYAMPHMSGTKFVQAAAARRPNLPVVYITGYADPEGLSRDAVIVRKPYRARDLLDAVARVLKAEAGEHAQGNIVPFRASSTP